ncbi:DUF58 domain-containing protein [Salsipaludibacter albus]|uniref:DUF58 domain-containing protein n=1 Tax=Salsipaludibacter albus TaxID=2849650 RepID=UPI001EE3AB66|nr:DUF58 domain-containing protein [Salsipaludibacter albus]MBY5161196.1 DUF58 domain-containing protein [Salsipaludibacter albus]
MAESAAWPDGPTPDDVARRVRDLELQVDRRLDTLLHGRHEGLTPGHGTEIGESRQYVPGDEVRRIDWNVTARTNVVHVRELIAERDLTTWLVVDLDANMQFGTDRDRKADVAAAAVAAIGFLNARDANRLGAILLRGGRQRVLPPRGGRRQVRAVLREVLAERASDGSGHNDLDAALHRVARLATHRGLVVLVSDLRGGVDDTGARVGGVPGDLAVVAQHHDVLVVEVTDPRDVELPDVGLIDLVDPATGTHREVVVTPQVRDAYAARVAVHRDQVHRAVRAAGADHLVLTTGQDWLTTVARHVHHRMRRRRRVTTGGGRA